MLADIVLDLRQNPEDWIVGWDDHSPPNWIDAVTSITTASLAFPVEIESKDVIAAYNGWLERNVLAPMRAASPNRYKAIVDHVRSFLANLSEYDGGASAP